MLVNISMSFHEDILNGFQGTERTASYSVLSIAVFHERSYGAIIWHTTSIAFATYYEPCNTATTKRRYGVLSVLWKRASTNSVTLEKAASDKGLHSLHYFHVSRSTTKPTIWPVYLSKTQISQSIRPV